MNIMSDLQFTNIGKCNDAYEKEFFHTTVTISKEELPALLRMGNIALNSFRNLAPKTQ